MKYTLHVEDRSDETRSAARLSLEDEHGRLQYLGSLEDYRGADAWYTHCSDTVEAHYGEEGALESIIRGRTVRLRDGTRLRFTYGGKSWSLRVG